MYKYESFAAHVWHSPNTIPDDKVDEAIELCKEKIGKYADIIKQKADVLNKDYAKHNNDPWYNSPYFETYNNSCLGNGVWESILAYLEARKENMSC